MRTALGIAVLCAASFAGDVYLDSVTSQEPPGLQDATLSRPELPELPELLPATEQAPALEADGLATQPGRASGPSGDVVEDEDYYDDDEYDDEDDGEDPTADDGLGGDGSNQDSDDEYEDDGEEESEEDEDDLDGRGDIVEGSGAEEDKEDDDEEVAAEETLTRQAEVRSLSDLPLSKLLQVQTELRRLAGLTGLTQGLSQRRHAQVNTERCEVPGPACSSSSPSWHPARPRLSPQAQSENPNSPSAQALNARESTASTRAPQRRGGGWEYEEYAEEEEDGGGWISWNKGKKKGKGDIGSVFQIAVTFLAFLAFGGYLLCLIIQAIKGGKGVYPYPYPYPWYGPLGSQGQLRPSSNVLLMMSPNRLTGTRRPTRPAAAGRRRRRRRRRAESQPERAHSEHSWWPEDQSGPRLWPHVDVDRMHRALLLVAEGYAAYYHKKYVR